MRYCLPRERPARRQQQIHRRIRDESTLAVEEQSESTGRVHCPARTAACPPSAVRPACPTREGSTRAAPPGAGQPAPRASPSAPRPLPAEPSRVADARRNTRPKTRNEYLRWSHGIRPTAATTSATRRGVSSLAGRHGEPDDRADDEERDGLRKDEKRVRQDGRREANDEHDERCTRGGCVAAERAEEKAEAGRGQDARATGSRASTRTARAAGGSARAPSLAAGPTRAWPPRRQGAPRSGAPMSCVDQTRPSTRRVARADPASSVSFPNHRPSPLR